MDPLIESKQAEAAHAAAIAKEAEHRVLEVMQDKLVEALKQALTYPGEDRPALVARIPVICNDVRDIKNDLGWIKKALIGIIASIGSILVAVVIAAIISALHG
jgi:hypothetical protein